MNKREGLNSILAGLSEIQEILEYTEISELEELDNLVWDILYNANERKHGREDKNE